MPMQFKERKLYYWKPAPNDAVLCRCEFVHEKYIALRVLVATVPQIIRWNLGPGEVIRFVPGTVPVEEAK